MLSKPETRRQLNDMLDAGSPKAEAFKHFSGGAVKDRTLAYFIACHPDKAAYARHRGKVMVLVAIMIIESLLGALTALVLSEGMGALGKAAVFGLLMGVPLLLAWGFVRNKAAAYNVYLILSFMNAQHFFNTFTQAPVANSIGLVIGLSTFAWVMYLRGLLFPDFLWASPRKIKGVYQFKERASSPPEQQAPFIDFTASADPADANPFSPPKAQVLKQPTGE